MDLKELLSTIHTGLAKNLADQVRRANKSNEPLTPQTIAAIAKFLKDNHIESNVEKSEPLADLVGALPDIDENNRITFPSPTRRTGTN